MANNKKLTVQTSQKPAITITRDALKADRLVYVAVANRQLRYPHGKSRIAYIGTTKTGATRIASSAAYRASDLLYDHGFTELSFFIVTCAPRQGVKTWKELEAGLILTFRDIFGKPPKCNTQGKNQKWKDERKYFTKNRLEGVVRKYSELTRRCSGPFASAVSRAGVVSSARNKLSPDTAETAR